MRAMTVYLPIPSSHCT